MPPDRFRQCFQGLSAIPGSLTQPSCSVFVKKHPFIRKSSRLGVLRGVVRLDPVAAVPRSQPFQKEEDNMKFATSSLLLVFALGATIAYAQNLPHFDHIIIIVQENRSPDNLFGAGPMHGSTCGVGDPFEPGVDIDNGAMATLTARDRDRKSVISRSQ